MKLPSISGFSAEAFNKYFKNTSWLLLARVGSLCVKMLVTAVLLPNYLGGSLFGTYNYPLTFLAFFIGIATLGTDGLVTRELLNAPDRKDEIMGSAFRIRLIGGLVALPLIYISYWVVSMVSVTSPAASFSQLSFVSVVCLIQSVQIIDSYFQSRAQGRYIMMVQVGANVISAILKALLVYFQASIDYFIAMLVVDICLFQIGYIFFYEKTGNSIFAWKYNPDIAKKLIQRGWPLALSAIFVTLYMKIDMLMIDAILGADKLGVYSTVVQYSESWYFIPVAISTALFPAIMNFRKNDPLRYKKRMQNLYDLMSLISISIALFMTFFSPLLYQILYPNRPEYMEGVPVLQIHIWSGVFAFLATCSSQYLIAEGLTKITLFRTVAGAIVNIVLNLLLIPRMGIIGAAYATLIAYFVAAFAIVLFPSTRGQCQMMFKSIFFIHLFRNMINRLSK